MTSKLKNIQNSVRQTVVAISAALGVEVAIIDVDASLVASSKGYVEAKTRDEEEEYLPYKPFINEVMLKKTIICKNPGYFSSCRGCRLEGGCPETAEVLCAIEMDGEVIGVMSMVAFDEEQRYRLLGKVDTILEFIHEMTDMLVSKIRERESIERVKHIHRLVETTLDSVIDGVITFNETGVINHVNGVAGRLLKTEKEALIGTRIDQVIAGTDVVDFVRGGHSIQQQEYIFPDAVPIHCLISIKPIYTEEVVSGGVLILSDIRDVRTVVKNMAGMRGNATFEAILGDSREITALKEQAMKVARSNSTVIIQGESGTGKELFARAIHSASPRNKGPFVAINCGAIPEMLLESELFGYEQGAFTGAKAGGKPGKFELADGGTLFLDEIGDMPLHLQVKLLRVLQERRLERVGGTTAIPLDIRIVAATNQDLESKVRTGEFRRDLFYRLNVIPLFVPPLRERKKDIGVLCQSFLIHFSQKLQKDIGDFMPATFDMLCEYPWPGNIRELENVIEYAVNIEGGPYVTIASLPARILEKAPGKKTLRERMREYENGQIVEALNSYGWGAKGKEKVARELGISVPSLYRKLMEMEKEKEEPPNIAICSRMGR